MFNWIVCFIKPNLEPFKTVQNYELRFVYKGFQQNLLTNHIYLIYMYKKDLAIGNLQWLICHKTKPKQIIYILYV